MRSYGGRFLMFQNIFMKSLSVLLGMMLIQTHGWAQWSTYTFTGAEKEIMEVVEKETLSFFMGEYVDWKDCWYHGEDIYFEWVRSNIHHFYTSWEELDRTMRPIVAENVASKDIFYVDRTDIQILREGDIAWVNYRQDLSGDRSHEQRVLRRVDGKWKIIMVTVVASDTFPKWTEN